MRMHCDVLIIGASQICRRHLGLALIHTFALAARSCKRIGPPRKALGCLQCIHPQFWPVDLDYRGRKVVVIGSGATAVTLVPTMAKETTHVTMLQRSPAYIVSVAGYGKIIQKLENSFHAGRC